MIVNGETIRGKKSEFAGNRENIVYFLGFSLILKVAFGSLPRQKVIKEYYYETKYK